MAITIDRTTKIISVPQADLLHKGGTLYELDTDWFRKQLKALEASEEGIIEPDSHSHNTEYAVAGVTYARKVEIINGYSVKFTPDTQWSVRLAGSNNNIFDVENAILQQNQVQVIAQNAAGLIVTAAGGGEFTDNEKEQIRDSLGIDGDKATAKNGQLQAVKDKTDNLPTDPASNSQLNVEIGSLNDLDKADVQDAMTDQGYTTERAPKLDNLDKAISTSESAVRGADGDTLKTVSDEIAAVKAVTDNIFAVESGKWEIVGSQMRFYRANGTIVVRVNLYGANGKLTSDLSKVRKRVPV